MRVEKGEACEGKHVYFLRSVGALRADNIRPYISTCGVFRNVKPIDSI